MRDTASGMRVIRRSALPDLYPLPDGLHFTPAMSARALLENKLHLVEVPIPYAERVGRSKLSVLRDGVRFLRVILRAAVAYRPSRPLLVAALLLGLTTLATAFQPLAYYARHRELQEPMIYRLMISSLLATLFALVLFSAAVSEQIAALVHRRSVRAIGVTGRLEKILSRGVRRAGVVVLLGLSVATSWPGIAEYATHNVVDMHWSRLLLSSLLIVIATMLGMTHFLTHMLELISAQQQTASGTRPPDRIRRGVD